MKSQQQKELGLSTVLLAKGRKKEAYATCWRMPIIGDK